MKINFDGIKELMIAEHELSIKEFTNINDNHIKMIVGFCNLDRTKLISNIIKIKTYFDKNKIDENELEILLRSDTNEIFNLIPKILNSRMN